MHYLQLFAKDTRQENNGQRARCLRKNHAALDMATRLVDPLHSGRAACTCAECTEDRGNTRVREPPRLCNSRLRQIDPKWVPRPGDERGSTEPAELDENSGIFVPPAGITSLSQGLRKRANRASRPADP